MHNKLKGIVQEAEALHPAPHEHALHLRWLSDELITQIKQAAKRRNMSLSGFVVSLIKRHLASGVADEPLGLCPVCKRRAASPSPFPHATPGHEVNVKAKEKAAAAETQATTCHHNLRRHPGCLKNGQHAHGLWWPREERNHPDCAKRRSGLKVSRDQRRQAVVNEKATSEGV